MRRLAAVPAAIALAWALVFISRQFHALLEDAADTLLHWTGSYVKTLILLVAGLALLVLVIWLGTGYSSPALSMALVLTMWAAGSFHLGVGAVVLGWVFPAWGATFRVLAPLLSTLYMIGLAMRYGFL